MEHGEGAGRRRCDPRRDFTRSHPPTADYLFGTSLDIQAPPGYVLRVEPHPRFYRDETETVAPAVCGQVQTEWFPKKLFVVFKIPAPGQRHIFRKGEPYAQALCIPRDDFVLTEMTPEERDRRRNLEEQMKLGSTLFARRVWVSNQNAVFSDYYNVLARAFARDGHDGVEALIREGMEQYRRTVPAGKSLAEYLELARQAIEKQQFVHAREILQHVVEKVDPKSPEAYRHLALLEWNWKLPRGAVKAMQHAVELAPNHPGFHVDMAILYRLLNRPDLARQELQTALAIDPSSAQARQLLGELTAGPSDGSPAKSL